MIWDKNLERLEKYMDKQIEKQTENKMSRKDHIEVLRAMAIGRTEKETIEYAIKQIKSAKKWKRKARIEYQRGYEDRQEYEQMLRTPQHDVDRIEKIKDLIRESDKNHAYTLSYPAYVFITRLKKIVGWQLEDYEERQPEKIHCKNCKYFERDHFEIVHGIPVVVAHEICKKWGDGCKTTEDGYCYLYEPKESKVGE